MIEFRQSEEWKMYLSGSASKSGDEMFLIRGDTQRGRQLVDGEQVLGKSSAQRQNPGVEAWIT